MKNRIFILLLSVMTVFACSRDQLITEDVNSIEQEAGIQERTGKKPVKRPFKLTAKGAYSVFVTNDGTCPEFTLRASTEGNATHLGRIVQVEQWCWNGTQADLGARTLTIIAANGDELYGTPISVEWSSFFTFEELVSINGGTGRFENATGEFRQWVEISRDENPMGGDLIFGSFSVSGFGTVTY
jgi:hypothetical protein